MGTSTTTASLADLRARLPELMLRDQHRLRRRLDQARRFDDPNAKERVARQVEEQLVAAEQRVERRRTRCPRVSYPDALPVSQRKDDIAAAIAEHQVVIVAGETGSGKTTQLPKICLELGRGVRGLIGHTQPRRLAARTVADRIAEELGTQLGDVVGYKVRFTDKSGDDTLVKLMTDGILLAEIQNDRMLRQYDTLIIDEAHERSLNIDFILGYLKQLLPRRPDLKVIITSATIDPERFARHFGTAAVTSGRGDADVRSDGAAAPIVEVSGRTYPVEVRYRPVVDDSEPGVRDPDRDQFQAICDAVQELCAEGPGDILVFCSGEREIRDAADALERQGLRNTEVLPLYARLSTAEQHRVFAPHTGRRVVLATNVAETSLTVPGIRYVVDPGTARISRYSFRTKVQRLPIEPISQASANQRKGRCGRVAEGVCIRLYSEDDFASRPEFTDPEILRTNLASVILQMSAAGLGDIERFPFVDPPDRRNITDGIGLLRELGALDLAQADPRKQLTPLGRKLAQLPLDPRLARMVIEAEDNGCVDEVMIVTAALSIQDPRERPADRQQAADDKHRRFADETSDFLAYLNLWRYLREQQQELSSNQFRRMCRNEFLNYLRIREWQDIHGQLRQVVKGLGVTVNNRPADPERVHVALLSGLLSHIGVKGADNWEYEGARGTRFAIFPGSALFKKPPRWVMAAELVETSRLWARIVARIEPEWAEKLAGHLVKRAYSEPHWEKKQGAVMAYEKVTLYGVPLAAGRKTAYSRIDPQLCRELFIRHALVYGEWQTRHAFFHANRRLLEEVEDLEHRVRRRDILVDDEALFDFYDQRLPADVVSARHFDSWWKKAKAEHPDLLDFSTSLLINEDAEEVSEAAYPDHWRQGELSFPLTYQFEPGAAADGVTAHVPLPLLNQVDPADFAWQIPGLREELVTALIRSLPKPIRRSFVPAPDVARAVLQRLEPRAEPLLDALGRELHRMSGRDVPRDAWQLDRVPEHLKVTFRVEDERRRPVAEGKDLEALRERLRPKVRATISATAPSIERSGLRSWDLDVVPKTFEHKRGAHVMRGYPALVDEGDSVAVRVLDTEAEQRQSMWRGTRRLLLLGCPSPVTSVLGRLDNQAKLALGHSPYPTAGDLFDDCLVCAVDKLLADAGGPAWDRSAFAALLDGVRSRLADTVVDVITHVARILATAHDVDHRVSGTTSLALVASLTDIREQLSTLVHRGFVSETGADRLPDVARYLQGLSRRLDKLPDHPARDRTQLARVAEVERAYRETVAALPAARRGDEDVRQIRWMLQELRVSYFAQEVRTAYSVSEKRIRRALDQLRS